MTLSLPGRMEGDCVLIFESVGKILRWNHSNETSQVLSHGIFPFFLLYYKTLRIGGRGGRGGGVNEKI